MSKLHIPSIERIENKDMVIFDALVEESEEFGNEVGQVCIPLIEEGDEFVVGTWVPELWLVVRKVLPDEEK
jgi:hypothetical protein